MTAVLDWLLAAWQETSVWEVIAVIMAIAYLVLAMYENILCWLAALISTSIYVVLFFDVNLYMESGLQIYYIIMALYGWYAWRKHSDQKDDLQISRWQRQHHVIAISSILIITTISAWLLRDTGAAYPWLDSLTTWSAVLTTWMVARKILENWLYWIVIDSISIYLFINKELYLTALLFLIYVILCISGYRQWNLKYHAKNNSEPEKIS